MTRLITFDGPKGVGKTTLISLVEQRLRELGRSVEVLTEKDLMAATLGQQLEDAYRSLKRAPGPVSDAEVARLHRQGRVVIGHSRLRDSASEVVLLDRWYPSDAVFRRYIDVSQEIDANLHAGVRIPDIAFAVTCNPEASWQRAHQRARRLDSKVIDTFNDHDASTARFERFAKKHGWHILRSDTASADELSEVAVEAIQASLRNAYRD